MARHENYEAAWGPVARRIQRAIRAVRWARKSIRGQQRMILVEVDWRLGDEIMAVEAVRALRGRYPRDAIFVLTNYPELYQWAGFPVIVNTHPDAIDRYELLFAVKIASRPGPSRMRGALVRFNLCPIRVSRSMRSLIPKCRRSASIAPSWFSRTKPHGRTSTGRRRTRIEVAARLTACHMAVIELGVRNPLGLGTDPGKTAVRDAAHILYDADLLVSVDNGLMHLALALGTPVVAFLVRPIRSTWCRVIHFFTPS